MTTAASLPRVAPRRTTPPSGETVARDVDVGAIVDGTRFAGLPALTCAFTVLALVFDGFDVQAVSFAAPTLLAQWNLPRAALGVVLAAGLLGMGVGALAFGALGDRWGRRRALIASMALLTVGALISALARSRDELAAYRFITGLALGGALPNATALAVELSPLRARHLAVAVTVLGVPAGGMLGAALASFLLPAHGWRSIFVVGAALPATLGVVMWVALPESPRFLALRSERRSELVGLLRRLGWREPLGPTDTFVVREPIPERRGLRAIFERNVVLATVLLWVIFATNVFASYAFFGWLPTALTGAGLSLPAALRGSFAFNAGCIAGPLLGAVLLARVGSRAVLAALACLSVLGALSLVPAGAAAARATDQSPALLAALAVTGLALSGVQVGMYSVAAHVYGTVLRATGVGWALGMGRLGGVASGLAGGMLLGTGAGLGRFFGGIAAVLLATAVAVIVLPGHIPPRGAPPR